MESSQKHSISVLVADDDADQRLLLEEILSEADWAEHRVTSVPDGRSALGALREQVFDVALLDLSMPGLDGLEVLAAIGEDTNRPQVIFVSGTGTVATATRAMKLGAYDFLEKPIQRDRLVALVWKAAEAGRLTSKSERLGAVVKRGAREIEIVTADPRMRDALNLVAKVASSDVSVLVMGESGTGKELIAREVHRLSGRHGEALVALNCAAVAENLAESELFGHEKGAFTGAASRKIGLLELADGGTLFLDEIGDLAPPLQAKLLRVLETKHFRRVGGVKEFPTDFRLVSATNRPLQDLVTKDEFRADLFYRINAMVLELPPLRERVGDITLLVDEFLGEFGRGDADSWSIAPDALALMQGYSWPGNVRELRNVIERAALLARGQTIRASDLGTSLSGDGATPAAATGGKLPLLELEKLERMAIEQALDRAGWHQGRAAEMLGVSPRTLHRKLKSYGLRRP
ncbi:MAG: sigma-54 dependent transcriptional regulator [Gemmatimonadota bacterium]|nr:sigma-54 dependent transcriptional regulator [Gemmatimonadota bacterium]MDH3423371.1 sigma-54 dependent transcriptional regulator [Gemmatimonadota bacterium]